MNIRFYIDPIAGLPHIHNHGVDEDEVEDVLRKPGEDRPGRKGSRVAVGQTAAGRYLRVIYVPDPEPDSVFVIRVIAFRMTKSVFAPRESSGTKTQTYFQRRNYGSDLEG